MQKANIETYILHAIDCCYAFPRDASNYLIDEFAIKKAKVYGMEFCMEKYANFVVVCLMCGYMIRIWRSFESAIKWKCTYCEKKVQKKLPKGIVVHYVTSTTKFNSIMTSKRGKRKEKKRISFKKTHTKLYQQKLNATGSWMKQTQSAY